MKTPILIFLLLLLSAAGSALLLAQEASGPQGRGAGWPYMEERGAVDMSGLESYMAPEAAPSFQLPADQSQPATAEAGAPVLDKALGLVGLPGMSNTSSEESTYEKAWRMSDSPNGTTRLTYGERYRRNPDGSYGDRSSSQWNSGNIGDRLLEQALSAGSGFFSSWAEGWLGGYGKARISLRVNDEGDVTGSGDFLYPIYDSESTTFFTQFGLRTMANDRVIGNFGLGQRFFLAENFALGYNAFIDQDFSRNHTRGGAGVEAWYDWVRLSANYYTPLSGWKNSKDYDSRFVEERPAEGYDARLTGYLPFYRNLALTGAFEKWKGEHVGSFGSDDVVQKDPRVWSYGLEWTPVPAFSSSVNQRHSGGQKETQFALTFNYRFGMDWEDQLSRAMVAEMRTVDGSRHDFVNRQNEMILEYRAKEGVYNIILLRTLDAVRNIFEFQITDGFGKVAAGRTVSVAADGGATILDPGSGLPAGQFRADENGVFQLQVSPLSAGTTAVTLSLGKTSRTFQLNVTPFNRLCLSDPAGPHYKNEVVTVTATLLDGAGQGLSGQSLIWKSDPAAGGAVTLTPGGNTAPDGVTTATVSSSTAQPVRVRASAMVNGATVQSDWITVIFDDNVYSLEADRGTVTATVSTTVKFTVKKNGAALANSNVTLSGVNGEVDTTQLGAFTTNGSGKISITNFKALNLSGGSTTITAAMTDEPDAPTTSRDLTVSAAVYAITLAFDSGSTDVIPSSTNNGTSTLKATVVLNGANAPDGTTVNWSVTASGWTNNGSSPNWGLQASDLGTLNSASSTTTGGVATIIFTSNKAKGTAGGARITGALAADPSKTGMKNIAVGFGPFGAADTEWYYDGSTYNGATGQCGNGKEYSDLEPYDHPASHYFSDTNLPTSKQLEAVSGADRPESVGSYLYWTGEGNDYGNATGDGGAVNLGDGSKSWSDAEVSNRKAVCLR